MMLGEYIAEAAGRGLQHTLRSVGQGVNLHSGMKFFF